MATKNNPGTYDCYAKADPDEPMFILLGRDKHAAEVVRYWVALKSGAATTDFWRKANLALHLHNNQNIIHSEKLHNALDCADAMENWRRTIGPTDAPGT